MCCKIKPVAGKRRVSMPTSIPNLITLGRILLVPIVIWAIASEQMELAFAALVLASLGFNFNPSPYDVILMALVTVFTLSSVALYLVEWVRHMSTIEAR